jgi:large subunit ribosomal protein L23
MLFKVQVESVQVANRQGKQKRSGRFMGRRNHTRRAFVCLKPGQEINFTEEAK